MKKVFYDAVIVGSGAGGGACAWALVNQGLKVLILEAGPVYNPDSDYCLESTEWETKRFPHKEPGSLPYSFGPMQELSDEFEHIRSWNHSFGRYNPSNKRMAWKYHHVQGVGGSTLHFTGEAHRLCPQSMHMQSRYGVSADWPITYQELEPFYSNAEKIVGVAGPNSDKLRPRSEPYPLPQHPSSYTSQKLAIGFRKLGLNWTANSLAILSKPYDGRPGCNYCMNCNRGCPRKDKGSVDVTFLHKVRNSKRCEIRTESRVINIQAGPNDRVTAVQYSDRAGNVHEVFGQAFIIAAGAIHTPRLLLLSKSKFAPAGLANDSEQVGKNFMETIGWTSSGIYPSILGSQRGLPSDGICWDYNLPDSIPNVIGGCRFAAGTAEADLLGPISYATRVVSGWGKAHKQAMRKIYGRVLCVNAVGESLSNPKSFIELDAQKKDSLGLSTAKINSYLDENEIRRIEFMAGKSREILDACGVNELFEEFGTYDIFSSTHVFGTCRMGKNWQSSVVDPFCRVHRWKNLFIVDASVFPSTGGGEAPSLTIEALALRTARYIHDLANRKELS